MRLHHKFNHLVIIKMSLPTSFPPKKLVYLSSKYTPADDDRFVSINELESSDSLFTLQCILIAQILYYKMSDHNNSKISIYNRGSKKAEYHPYSRMVTLMCLTSQPGRNCFSILVGKQRNSAIFDAFLHGRDSGSFQPGAIICIHRPQCVNNWLGGAAGHPLLDVPNSFQVVDISKCIGTNLLMEVPAVETSERLHGFYYSNVKLKLLNIHFIHSCCGGQLCGSLDMYSGDGFASPICACFHTIQRVGNILMMVTIQVTNGDKSFVVKNFTSRKFTNLFLEKEIPTGLTATMLNENDEFVRSYIRKVQRAFQQVNDNGQFHVSGWLRKGFIADEGLTSAVKEGVSPASGSSKVKSSDSTYHITSVGFNEVDIHIAKTNLSDAMVVSCGGDGNIKGRGASKRADDDESEDD